MLLSWLMSNYSIPLKQMGGHESEACIKVVDIIEVENLVIQI